MKYYKSDLLGEWIKEGKYCNERNTKQKNLGETGDKRKKTEVLLRYLSPRSAILRRATIVPTEKRKSNSWRGKKKRKKGKEKIILMTHLSYRSAILRRTRRAKMTILARQRR